MAHRVEPFCSDWSRPHTVAESRAWNHVAKVFGRCPSSIRRITAGGSSAGVYLVELQWGGNGRCEFICADGIMLDLPRKS